METNNNTFLRRNCLENSSGFIKLLYDPFSLALGLVGTKGLEIYNNFMVEHTFFVKYLVKVCVGIKNTLSEIYVLCNPENLQNINL